MIQFKYPQRFVIAVMAALIARGFYHAIPALLKGDVPLMIVWQVAFCTFLAWKIHTRPLAWGVGIGVYLIVAAVAHIVIIAKAAGRIALSDPTYAPHWPLIIGWESLLFMAGVCSVFLRVSYSKKIAVDPFRPPPGRP
jgi:hypothetical protein